MRFITTIRPLARQRSLARPFSTSYITRKDPSGPKDSLLDREKINREGREYSKSQSDDAASQEGAAAFDPNITSPEGEMAAAGSHTDNVNPLEGSPANQDLSKPQDKGDSEMSGSSPMKTEKHAGGKRSGRGDA